MKRGPARRGLERGEDTDELREIDALRDGRDALEVDSLGEGLEVVQGIGHGLADILAEASKTSLERQYPDTAAALYYGQESTSIE